MTSSLPLYYSSTIPILHFPFSFSSTLIKTTSSDSIFISFVLCIILCLSRRDRKYSFFPSFPCCLFTLVDITLAMHYRLPIQQLCVKTGIWMSSSIEINGRLCRTSSMSSKISSSTCLVRFSLPVALIRYCFTNPAILLNYPPHHGALFKLNFHFISSLIGYSYIFSSLLIVLIHFEAATKVFALSKYQIHYLS